MTLLTEIRLRQKLKFSSVHLLFFGAFFRLANKFRLELYKSYDSAVCTLPTNLQLLYLRCLSEKDCWGLGLFPYFGIVLYLWWRNNLILFSVIKKAIFRNRLKNTGGWVCCFPLSSLIASGGHLLIQWCRINNPSDSIFKFLKW